MPTTVNGVADTELTTNDFDASGVDAFLKNLLPEGDPDADKQPSEEVLEEEKKDRETPEDEGTEPSEETPDDEEAKDEGEPAKNKDNKASKKYVESDDHFTKVKVGEEEREVPVKDLKRLFGQEAALTRRSQEVARQRDAVVAQAQQYTTGLQRLVSQAETRANQFRQVNFLQLSRDQNVSNEQLEAIQTEAQKAFEEEKYFKTELSNVNRVIEQEENARLAEIAKDTVKEVTDQASPYYIENFNKDTYVGLLKFAKDNGVPAAVADRLVDKSVLKLLHKAMLYDKGKTVTTKVVNKTPKKILKTNVAPAAPTKSSTANSNAALKALKKSGSQEDAANAFLARWADPSE